MFVNPFGGKKSASKIFSDQVKPLLEDADIQLTLQGLDPIKSLNYEILCIWFLKFGW